MIRAGRLTALALVLAGLAIVPVSAESESALDGWYVAEGFDIDGTRYRALVELRRDAQSYRVAMFVSQPSDATEPELAAIGVGLQSHGMLAVNYYTPDHARLAMYRIEGRGRLIGQWILVGGDGTARAETLTRIAGALAISHIPSPPPAYVKGGACSVPTVAARQVAGDSRSRAVLAVRSGTYEEERMLAQTSLQPTSARDSVWNGLLIGAGVGALLGLIPDHYDDCEECHDSMYASIAVGAGIGAVIDLLRSGKPSPSPSSKDALRMGVTVSPRSLELAGRIAWR